MDWLNDNVWLFWLGVALVLAAIEAATVDFVFIMFAGGALAAAVAAGLGASFPCRSSSRSPSRSLLLVLGAAVIKRQFLDGEVDHQIGTSALVGREARVLAVRHRQRRPDQARRRDLVGPARRRHDHHVGPGEEVRVIAIHGATAIVSPAPPTDRRHRPTPTSGPHHLTRAPAPRKG